MRDSMRVDLVEMTHMEAAVLVLEVSRDG